MTQQIVTFVIDKELDITNHFIGINSYKQKRDRNFQQNKNETIEKLLLLNSRDEQRAEIIKSIEKYYVKTNKLEAIAQDINTEWSKIEKDFISQLEKVHKFSFPFASIKGVLSSTGRFGYNVENNWFATSMFRNKFEAIDTATHELMHFMFHKYYDKVCMEKGLSKDQMWDVKESFTVLLNLEFDNFRFQTDNGYTPHTKIREVIATSWQKDHDFDKALDAAITFVKKS